MRKYRNINLDLLKVLACVGVMESFDIFILLRNLFYSSIFYGQWLFIVRKERDNLFLHTAESKMDSNNSVIMDHYRLAL